MFMFMLWFCFKADRRIRAATQDYFFIYSRRMSEMWVSNFRGNFEKRKETSNKTITKATPPPPTTIFCLFIVSIIITITIYITKFPNS